MRLHAHRRFSLSVAIFASSEVFCWGFTSIWTPRFACVPRPASQLSNSASNEETGLKVNGDADGTSAASAEDYFGGMAEFMDFVLEEHKPLGCTAEESLADEVDGAKHVFVSKVVNGGNAEKAGVMVGDVIVGVSGTFDDTVDVAGLGLDKVRSLIAGRNPDDSLSLRVARGTDIMQRHESAMVDLCTIEVDVNLDSCLNAINEYDLSFEDDGPTVECGDEDTECLLDQMFGGWGEEIAEMNGTPASEKNAAEEKEPEKPKPKPWSSRSSPSGTFVRNPKTGKMENIDA
uniref:PDZ domain-containing protein n=1 Tax=Trieres chinensis TaxID=1514140 RepID=A0A7S1ZNQ0_TRICV|mmetsp:Transcript_29708/g.60695  ORF Transcript_29708/g.60695 Transcript_29708/m.60695 type:complete len:289 (+) Transcript_29708:136-1002(+)|eukprot:CAMPEP_0183307662 /NCGR_PEP_ID=MMETSP0160_2-20130417/18641_1 /TAXON_ID=2839 ORGANISM="Odontella Sinensis, Strain Grunow 1884" /NCGR_SAMPLE_ID=MMETSP0160_2 /ASSEMBLY_ACC=CAM_ASM_000250 /LENGTH=288 /DNA_ID=CAMNT_0025471299 /DNA_START=86 /DNA_END=952 /DNA_ORIENTATION=-